MTISQKAFLLIIGTAICIAYNFINIYIMGSVLSSLVGLEPWIGSVVLGSLFFLTVIAGCLFIVRKVWLRAIVIFIGFLTAIYSIALSYEFTRYAHFDEGYFHIRNYSDEYRLNRFGITVRGF